MPHKQRLASAQSGPSSTAASAPSPDAPLRRPGQAKQPKPTQTSTTIKTTLHRPLSDDSTPTPGAQQRRRHRLRSVARRLRHAENLEAPSSSRPPPARAQDGDRGGGGTKRRALPATTRAGLERELAALRREEAVARAEAARARVMKKYKMVRFFETRKALRRVKGARKAAQDASEGAQQEEAERKRRVAEVDWRYATYFPLERRYVSLFRGEKDDREGEGGGSGDPQVRARIEAAMEEGGMAALEAIRCELTVVEHVEDKGRREEGVAEDDDESDGGFFE